MALFGRPSAKDDQKAAAYRDWLQQRDPFAIASLILGVFSLIEFGALIIFGVAGIVLGALALKRLASTQLQGHRLAWIGIVLSVLSLVIAAVLYTLPRVKTVTGCFTWLLIIVGLIFTITSMIRWFEQITEAVDNRWWNKVLILVAIPPAVWFFPSRVSAGRPVPVPIHEPVKGMGTAPKIKTEQPPGPPVVSPPTPAPSDGPPPGTPKEFIGMPVIPPKRPGTAPAIDPEKLAKLKEKMRQQGMLGDDDTAA